MSTIYVAGPMTGLPGYNRDAFRAASADLADQGWDVIDPSRYPPGLEWSDYIRLGLTDLLTASHVALLPGWTNSVGANLEARVALALEIPCYPLVSYLR